MSNKLCHTNIPTARLFGIENAYSWNPVRGCNNFSCPLHPKNSGKCWAAQLCRFHAKPWAESEGKYCYPINVNESLTLRTLHSYMEGNLTENIKNNLKFFNPTWFQSQFDKEFPRRQSCILVGYQTDLAYVPREWTSKILGKIEENNREREAAGLPLHVFQFLTKSPGKLYPFFEWPINCWLGITAITNAEKLDRFNATWYWILHRKSGWRNLIYAYFEPLIEGITGDMRADWVIVGGGPDPINPDWVRSIKNQCQAAGIRFYFKQWGEWVHPSQKHPYYDGYPLDEKKYYIKAGKKKAGNLLDGQKWEQFPEVGHPGESLFDYNERVKKTIGLLAESASNPRR